MEQQIQKRVIEIAKRNQDQMAEENGIQSSLSEDEMKQYLAQVIREVKKQRTNNKKGKTNNGNA
jgi:Asp-tRNA(Asn)/Glu-tRNA(Gln) amidotransferase B subunit